MAQVTGHWVPDAQVRDLDCKLHAYTITCVWLSGKQVGTLAVLYRQTTPEMLPTVQAASGPFQARLQVGLSEQSAPRALEP